MTRHPRAGPTALHPTVRRASVPVIGVAVVAFLLPDDRAIPASGLTMTRRPRTGPTSLHPAVRRASVPVIDVTVVTFLLPDDHSIATARLTATRRPRTGPTSLHPAVRRASVPVIDVTVVTFLPGNHDPVSTCCDIGEMQHTTKISEEKKDRHKQMPQNQYLTSRLEMLLPTQIHGPLLHHGSNYRSKLRLAATSKQPNRSS